MKKLVCDICNSNLEMNADGQGAVCTSCGMTYSVARLKEMLSVPEAAQQAAIDVVYDVSEDQIETVYDVTDFEVVAADAPKQFYLLIEDVFHIAGRGMVATGYVQGASVHVDDAVTVVRMSGEHLAAKVSGIEMYKKLLDRADPGDAVGILLMGTKPGQVAAGDVLTASAAPGQTTADYYKLVYCPKCGIPLRITKEANKRVVNCPDCNTQINLP